MNKELCKAIYDRNRLRNRFCKALIKENKNLYKKQRNKCVLVQKKRIRYYFNKIVNLNIVTNRFFWKIIRAFLQGAFRKCRNYAHSGQKDNLQ